MNASLLAAFWAVSMMFVITPGADWAYAISAGMRDKAIVPAVAKLLLGHLVATLIVAAGVGALVTSVPYALTALTLIGAAYLLWLGVGLITNPPVPTAADDAGPISPARWLAKGFGVSGLNPKVILLFLALLPQFVDTKAAWPIPAQIVALGLVHVVNCGIVYLLVGNAARLVLRTRPQAAKVVGRVSGAVMLCLAVGLSAEALVR
ncbi:LysE family translocator [Sphingomonas sp. 2R-10]|uniref:LysE family translocator n=1 Tax=Sphingomonas sp. 2R-10 TaxID=3045148 RepID=UPI000F77EFDA|nr:LysE family translocator [Sphingomonas sp. 2R-10]MDJ0277155.1 LysE family translocator [Sphingomonas sp. 2R-10]